MSVILPNGLRIERRAGQARRHDRIDAERSGCFLLQARLNGEWEYLTKRHRTQASWRKNPQKRWIESALRSHYRRFPSEQLKTIIQEFWESNDIKPYDIDHYYGRRKLWPSLQNLKDDELEDLAVSIDREMTIRRNKEKNGR